MSREVKTDFGTYQVYEDSFSGNLVPRSNQIRESELAQLEQAWKNIHQGKGMNIIGTDADKALWDKTLIQGLTTSETFRQTFITIGNDPKNTISVDLGRNQPGVAVDSFQTNQVDLADLAMFPSVPRPNHSNEVTQSEVVIHFLQERYHNKVNGLGFEAAHQSGIDLQNRYRDERGQSNILNQQVTSVNPDGSVNAAFNFQNGTSQQQTIDSTGKITNIIPPNDITPEQNLESRSTESRSTSYQGNGLTDIAMSTIKEYKDLSRSCVALAQNPTVASLLKDMSPEDAAEQIITAVNEADDKLRAQEIGTRMDREQELVA